MDENGEDVKLFPLDTSIQISDAKWSRDGSMVAVSSNFGLQVMDADGKNLRLVAPFLYTANDDLYFGPGRIAWSPDSRSLAYSRLMLPEAIGNFDIFVTSLDQASERRLTHTLDTVEHITDWGRNGLLMGDAYDFETRDSMGRLVENTHLIFLDTCGNTRDTWGTVGMLNYAPVSSRSGALVAYISNVEGNSQLIHILNLATQRDTTLETSLAYRFFRPVAWSSDDSKILCNVGSGVDYGKIFVVDLAHHQSLDITPFDVDTLHSLALSWGWR